MNATPESMDLSPEEAARALSGIRATQARAVRTTPWFPTWFVVGIGLSVTLIQVSADPLTPVPLRIACAVLAAAGIAGSSIAIGRSGRMRAHRSVISAAGMLGYTGWLLALIACTVAAAVFLTLSGVPYGATYACLGMTAAMALTGPLVARWISGRNAAKIERGR
ncbi:hypothetical protein PS9374_05430 [Planomonospora sphaerica]|uniref:Transmembrane protein n=1 Tax=Planomonospora sphaerica TaxID=161355 RepID=A0A161MDL9_9ACTN|nr:hypothetical protein [Planomonospora sphaerica]GAT69753.1 hypothetical protein PS9374_05430 [Planomonospora sphaerica]